VTGLKATERLKPVELAEQVYLEYLLARAVAVVEGCGAA
jgi:hypothetical protein